jgi:hypothetical protein
MMFLYSGKSTRPLSEESVCRFFGLRALIFVSHSIEFRARPFAEQSK